jgi:hypothetical protein
MGSPCAPAHAPLSITETPIGIVFLHLQQLDPQVLRYAFHKDPAAESGYLHEVVLRLYP